MLFRLSPSVIYDTIRAHAAMRAADSAGESPGALLDIFLSPDREGIVAILIKNSFARVIGRLPSRYVISSAIDDETAVGDPGELTLADSVTGIELSAELAVSSDANAAAMRRSLEQAVAMDVLAGYAALRGDAETGADFRALADLDISAVSADLDCPQPFLRSRWM